MTEQELADRIAELETANRRFRALASVLGLGLMVLVAAGWVGPAWGSVGADGSDGEANPGTNSAAAEAPREVRARSVVLVDDSGRPAVRMETADGALRISMLDSGHPVRPGPAPGPDDSARIVPGAAPTTAGSSLVLYPTPRIVLYGPGGRTVVRLGEVEAVRSSAGCPLPRSSLPFGSG